MGRRRRPSEQAGQDSGRQEARAPVLLSRAELDLFAALEDLSAELGYAPTYRELAARLGWRSRGSIGEYVERLRRKGVVEGSGRSLRTVR